MPTVDGVHVFGAGADLALRGPSAYRWLDRVAPHLDGTVELDALVGGLPAEKREAVRALVGQLHTAGCLVDAGADLPHGLTPRECATYASEIAFVEYHGDSAAHRFETYRRADVVVVGAGRVFVALVSSVLRSGVRRVRAALAPERPTDIGRLTELVAEATDRDPDQELLLTDLGRTRPEDLVDGAGAVLHVGEGDAVERALLLDRLCRGTDTALVQGLVLDDVAWLGPVGDGWRSAWQRLDARGPFRENAFLTGPAAAVVASHLGLAAFVTLTGITTAPKDVDAPDQDAKAVGELTRIDLETLRTSTHTVLPHPAARPVRPEGREEFTRRIGELRAGAPVTGEEFSRRAARCFDPYVGVLRVLEEGEFTQIPLHVAKALAHTEDAGPVYGVGLDFAEARRDAALRGLARYAAHRPDTRRYGPGGTLWGWDPAAEQAAEVAADRVFTAADETGVGAGTDWDAAVTAGLGGQCARTALADAAAGAVAPRPVTVGVRALSPRATRLWDLLRAARGTPTVADIGGALGVPVLAWWQDGRTVAVTCGPDAVEDGLRAVLLDRQSVITGEPGYAPVPPGPCVAMGPGTGRPLRAPAGATAEAMLGALRARGVRPLVVPLDHDPVVAGLLPFVVRVVPAGDGAGERGDA
ncbi:hypothetical protein ACIBEA_15900 [Streptomyces sp. NPDC051555]|uniref:hypothetical protein n=1 Tax=Streptomyces sp. NPDC051555 TaxID=3365657 RepID=UPI0037B585B0